MFHHRKPTWRDHLRELAGALRRPDVTRWQGPCGHQVNGDSRSWWCPTCNESGSSSS